MSLDANEKPQLKPSEEFVNNLKTLKRADLAVLKRNAGHTVAESRGAMGLFYRVLPQKMVGSMSEDIYFLVATLYPLNRQDHDGDFGATMRAVKTLRGKTKENDSMDRRMNALLDSEFESVSGAPSAGGEMTYRLRQAVKLAAAAGIGINWQKLVEDLSFWSYPDRRARKRWARSYYGDQDSKAEIKPQKKEETGGAY